MPSLNTAVDDVTQRIIERSRETRAAYLARINALADAPPNRGMMGCTNLAHAFAAAPERDKIVLHAERAPNLAIVTSYNDMLSAHQPYENAPEKIREAARAVGATAQVAGGTPAMCDGVTQGQLGMELSLFSRDVIAMSTAIALSHNVFDAGVFLGVCDKIVPGLLMGALSFGHLPAVFIPAGPMTTGIPNKEKARTRQLFAEGKATREDLLASESASYHGPGTCTFYGTANSNQMMMEIMGLHLPGAAFINPGTELRSALTTAAAQRALALTARGNEFTPLGRMIDEKAIVNAIIGLLATGGSTNHTLHLVAIARTAGISINWDDFDTLSHAIPLLTHVYPSGQADVNQFHAAGGMALVIRELLDAGLLHDDVQTVAGASGLYQYTQEPWLDNGTLAWRDGLKQSVDDSIISTAKAPFQADGGLRLMSGNLGRAVIKTSAVKQEHRIIEAPAVVFHSQDALRVAFDNGELEHDFIAVIAYQGPRANGMPELHKLTPILGVLLDRGFKVGLVTDGRMSGASGKVPAAIHVSPECVLDGPLAKVRTGDIIRMDAESGTLQALVDEAEWDAREVSVPDLSRKTVNMGRELFSAFRHHVCSAELGAVSLFEE
ncbi:phosphogluconate dehydratase [Granulosicoccus sp. 3-233]|uniref:phosphogluconate dehydratase n=1 Tax=Granulosicoccus sp. 3-233 TaxID=3417969 RepID=UPI003D346A72